MELNVMKCQDFMDKIKKSLQDSGYNILKVNNNVLCKTPRTSVNKYKYSNGTNLPCLTDATSSSARKYQCPKNTSGCIDESFTNCTCSGACNIVPGDCPLHNGSSNNNSNTNLGSYGKSDCLFRIMPTDIYNGIFLHAIFLHGEHTDLKMTFGYEHEDIMKIVETINFLVG